MNLTQTALVVVAFLSLGARAVEAGLTLDQVQEIGIYSDTVGTPSHLRAGESAVVWQVAHHSSERSIQAYDFQEHMSRVIRWVDWRENMWPDVSGRTVIWSEDEGATHNIFAQDLDSGQIQRVTSGGTFKFRASVEGNLVVWEEWDRDSRFDVYGAFGPDWTAFPIANSPTTFEGLPDVSGGKVVYDEGATLKVVNLNTSTVELVVPTQVTYPDRPQIAGNHVAWFDGDSLEIINIVTKDRHTVPEARGFALGEDVLVYYDQSAAPRQALVALNLTDGAKSVLRADERIDWGRGNQAIWGRRLTWIEWEPSGPHSGIYRIYSANIIPEPSTLILLGMGAVGLLAYAWRRRR